MDGYYYYCYAIFSQPVRDWNVSAACSDYAGKPVWFDDAEEFDWLLTVLQEYSVDCLHLGMNMQCKWQWLKFVHSISILRLIVDRILHNLFCRFIKIPCLKIVLIFFFTGLRLHNPGLFPIAESFDLLRADYIRSMGLNHTFIPGFSSHVQTNFLNDIRMGYCTQSGEVSCDDGSSRTMVCKIPCK